ncbi:MAG TPA: FdtA/QdtA family cupin domain-containing protein [Flavobacteriaceae bacterium]|nr:FdtA/QdtA family cupin domain-containing protein [Flavobacteriaceae bacterium]
MAGDNNYGVNTSVHDIKLINIPIVSDVRGNLAVIEKEVAPFEIKRVYYLFDVPSDSFRGGHAHKELFQLVIPLSGSFDVHLDDGVNKRDVTMNKANKGMLIVPGIWREIGNFSSGAVCLVLASLEFDETDYVREYNKFVSMKRG